MASDRFIRWGEDRPTKEQIQFVLEDYFGSAAEVKWDKDRFYVTLPGKPSFPFRRIVPDMARAAETQDERWIEVWMNEDSLDVMTRMMDHYTNDLARGLTAVIANYWQA